MKKQIWKATALFAGLGLLASCSSEETQVTPENQDMEVSFSANILDITRAEEVDPTGGTGACEDPDTFDATNYIASITITNGADGKDYTFERVIRKVGTNVVSDPITLTKLEGDNAHKLKMFTIVDADEVVYWSTVEDTDPDGKYETFVADGQKTPITITWGDDGFDVVKKQTVPLTLLCAVNDKPEDFGYGQWNVNFVKAICLNYSINTCGDNCDTEVPEGHKIGQTNVTIAKYINGEYETLWTGTSDEGKENIGEMCFNDESIYDDADELFKITLNVVGWGTMYTIVDGEKIFDGGYINSGLWDKPLGAAEGSGYLHFDLCDFEWRVGNTYNSNGTWVFTVSEVVTCGVSCEDECPSFFTTFSTFTKFGCDPCDWKGWDCFKRYNGGLVYTADAWKFLKSPGYAFQGGETIQIKGAAYMKSGETGANILSARLVPMPTASAAPAVDTRHSDKKTKYTWTEFTVEVPVTEANCWALKLCLIPRCHDKNAEFSPELKKHHFKKDEVYIQSITLINPTK